MLLQTVQVLCMLVIVCVAPSIHAGPSESTFGVVVSTEIGVRSISLPDKTVTILSRGPSRGVSFNRNLKKVFFSEFTGPAHISSVNLDGTDFERLFTWSSQYFDTGVRDIAVDERTDEVYFSTWSKGIHRCNRNVLFSKDISTPNLINEVFNHELNPSQETIYWVNRGTKEKLGSIVKANMDGSNATVIISCIAFEDWPQGIAVDGDRILWTQTTLGPTHTPTIHTSDLEGRNHQVFLTLPTPSNIYEVVTHQDRLYLADRDNMIVYSVNKYNGSDPEVLATGLRVNGIGIYKI